MKKLLFLPLIILLVIGLFIAFKSGNNKNSEQSNTSYLTPGNQTFKGVSLSPKSYSNPDFQDFFIKAKEVGNIISWAGDWKELDKKSSPPFVIAELAKQKYFEYLILTSIPIKEDKEQYINLVTAYVKKYQPKFFAIGVEVNVKFERNVTGLDDFSDTFSKAYNEIKKVSPNTKVFTVFQLEKMKGLSGGLFGGKNDTSTNHWDIIYKFDKSDLIGFTTYPGIIYKDPNEIPENYYEEIKTYIKKPIAFTEIGWPSSTEAKGWESTEVEQSQFITKFFSLSKNIDSEITIWPFLYDPENHKPFDSVGLIDKDNNKKVAWHTWVDNK